MIDVNFILSKLPPYAANAATITNNQSVSDIKKAILQAFETDKKQYSAIAPYFVGNTVKDTCKNVFDFLRKNVLNVTESVDLQSVKTPAAILATGKTTGSDCKNFSLFAAGILDAINRSGVQKIPIAFRFCKYKQWDGSYLDHVFVVVYPDRKNEIWVDCIKDVPYFDAKKYPDYYTDKKINSMALVRVSGMPTMAKDKLINGLLSERAKRLSNGQIKAGSVQDMRYKKALATMGVFDPTQLTAPVQNNQLNQAIVQTQSSDFFSNFLNSQGGGINVASLLSGNLDLGGAIKSGAEMTANALLPGSGQAVDAAINLIANLLPSKGGLYADWSKDSDQGLAEVVRWTRNDGDNPKQEASDIMKLIQERGWSTYIGKPTRYGDAPLTVKDVYDKLVRVGLTSEAQQLMTAITQATTGNPSAGTGTAIETMQPTQKKSNPLLIGGLALAAVLLLKK